MISIFTIILIFAVILAIIFGVILIVGHAMNIAPLKLTGLIGTIIGIVLLMLSAASIGVVKQHQKNEQIRQAKIKKNKDKKFKTASSLYIDTYTDTWDKAEKLGNKEINYWYDQLETDSYDVNSSLKKMNSKYDSDINSLTIKKNNLISYLKIMKNNDTGRYNLKMFEDVQTPIIKLINDVTSPSGSYDSFVSDVNKHDSEVSNSWDKSSSN